MSVVGEAEAQASRIAALEQLLDVAEPTILEQATQLEQALAESRNLFESAADAILIADSAGRIVRLNRQAEQMFGYTRDALLGQPVELLVPQPLRAGHELLRKAYVEQTPPRKPLIGLAICSRHESGAEIPTELTVSPIETAGDLLMIVILRDVTERRRAEEHLRRQNILLEEIARAEHAAHEARKQLESQLVQSERPSRSARGLASDCRSPTGSCKCTAAGSSSIPSPVGARGSPCTSPWCPPAPCRSGRPPRAATRYPDAPTSSQVPRLWHFLLVERNSFRILAR